MSLSDPIADMLTRIRNAARVRKQTVMVRGSKICRGIAEVLQREGYIKGYDWIDDGKQGALRIELKYGPNGEQVLTEIKRVSRPGCRVYRSIDQTPRVLDGLGVAILSTSRGVLSDRQCREAHVGGEVLCTVT